MPNNNKLPKLKDDIKFGQLYTQVTISPFSYDIKKSYVVTVSA